LQKEGMMRVTRDAFSTRIAHVCFGKSQISKTCSGLITSCSQRAQAGTPDIHQVMDEKRGRQSAVPTRDEPFPRGTRRGWENQSIEVSIAPPVRLIGQSRIETHSQLSFSRPPSPPIHMNVLHARGSLLIRSCLLPSNLRTSYSPISSHALDNGATVISSMPYSSPSKWKSLAISAGVRPLTSVPLTVWVVLGGREGMERTTREDEEGIRAG
jgi:hypothetical protein